MEMENNISNIRRNDDLLCGRLVAMPSNKTLVELAAAQQNQGLVNVISIDFPAMPDTLELARSTDYIVKANLVAPDGIHQYQSTKPLEIPFSFKLHALDSQYCKQGALTLIQVAARLHSFVLPISTYPGHTIIAPTAPKVTLVVDKGNGPPVPTGQDKEAAQEYTSMGNQNNQVAIGGQGAASIYSPVTCWLHLMWVGENQPGVSCIGYVKEVKATFCGPWLRGPNSSFNLPSGCEYSFTFVHRPGHGNSSPFTSSDTRVTTAETPQTFADDVRNSLYNTQNLVGAANYQGFAGGDYTK